MSHRDDEPTKSPSRADAHSMSDSARPLVFRSQRDRLAAPELERYLGQRDVDLQLVDQIEALRVRIERGLAVLSERAGAATRQTRRIRQLLRVGTALMLAAVITAAFLDDAWIRALGWSVGAALSVASMRYELLLAEDLRRLARFIDTDPYRRRIAACTDIRELFALSQSLQERVRELSGARDVT